MMSGRMHRGWHGAGRGGRGPGRGGWQQADLPGADDASAWLQGRLPDEWFTGAPEVTIDREEIVIVGELPAVEGEFADTEAGRADRAAAVAGRISRFRESTREERIEIARQAEHRYQRKVAWGARIGDTVELFTVASVPVMTRLRQPERIVLDTLVDSGVARSRSDALAWAVRLVGQHADEWLSELREAMARVDELRAKGPTSGTDD
jgi:Arc/MetJ-type ribon-helix-helix transcriptional regulator